MFSLAAWVVVWGSDLLLLHSQLQFLRLHCDLGILCKQVVQRDTLTD